MTTDIRTFEALRRNGFRNVFPTFHRPRCWSRGNHWESPRNDVRGIVQEYGEGTHGQD